MIQINKNQACFPHYSAKLFEIILIIGFLLTIILLIINLALTIWFFKNSHSLFIIEIGLLGLNALSFILSIILRIWRSDGSVLNSNLSSSNTVAVINLIFVIINLLLSISEEVLFSFVFPFIIYNIGEMTLMNNLFNGAFNDNNINFGWNNNDDRNLNDDYYDWDDDYNWDYDDGDDDFWGSYSGLEENKLKNFYKIMDKLDEEKGEFGIDIDDDADFAKILKKLNTLKILPWIAFNFNILIQFIMFIFIIIIIGRIKRRSDFGISRNKTNQGSQNRMLGNRRKSNDLKNLGLSNIDSEQKNLGKKKHKKKSKKKSIRVHNKY